MFYLYLFLGGVAAYLYGNISFARLFARLGKGVDITAVGNHNPGTSNVMREVGPFWGMLTFFGDSGKGFVPMLIFSRFIFSSPAVDLELPFAGAGTAALFLIGIAGLFAHKFPVFYRFKGGGGVGTVAGIFLFWAPLEWVASMLFCGFIVQLFFKNQKHPHGQLTPTFFLILMPFLFLFENKISHNWFPFFRNSIVFPHLGWGNRYLWSAPDTRWMFIGILTCSLLILFLNVPLLVKGILQKEEFVKE